MTLKNLRTEIRGEQTYYAVFDFSAMLGLLSYVEDWAVLAWKEQCEDEEDCEWDEEDHHEDEHGDDEESEYGEDGEDEWEEDEDEFAEETIVNESDPVIDEPVDPIGLNTVFTI